MSVLFKVIDRLNAVPIKIPIVNLCRNRKYIQKFIWNLKGSQIVKKKNLNKEQSWKSYACCFKTHKVIVSVVCNKYRHIDQWNRRKNLETNTSFYVANYF